MILELELELESVVSVEEFVKLGQDGNKKSFSTLSARLERNENVQASPSKDFLTSDSNGWFVHI